MRVSTCTRVSNLFRQFNSDRPSQVAEKLGISDQEIESVQLTVAALLPFDRFRFVFYSDEAYPHRLKDAKHPIPAFYYQGKLDLLSTRSVAVIGTRKPTPLGIRRAQKLARFLIAHQFTVMSGLAQGIDTAAHSAALSRRTDDRGDWHSLAYGLSQRKPAPATGDRPNSVTYQPGALLPLLPAGLPQESVLLFGAQ
jgi:hypothetical protein